VPGSAGSAPLGDEGVAERAGRCLQRLRQWLRVRLGVRYWLWVRCWFWRRPWPRLRPGLRRHWRRHGRGHRWWHGRRFHRVGPCWLWLGGFGLRCPASIWSGLWCYLGGHFAVGHRGLTGTICAHPEMIPSRALCSPRGGRPISTSCALTCAALRAGPARSIHAGRTARWHPDRAGVPIVSWMPGECAPRRWPRIRGPGAPGGVLPGAGCLAAWHHLGAALDASTVIRYPQVVCVPGLCAVNRGRPSRADPALDTPPPAAPSRARRNGGHKSQGAARQSPPRAHTRLRRTDRRCP
jgi:hypothetical protein